MHTANVYTQNKSVVQDRTIKLEYWESCSGGGWALDCKSSTLETQGVRIPPLPQNLRKFSLKIIKLWKEILKKQKICLQLEN